MYEERKDGFSIKGVIIQILLVVLVVFLLLWLFPSKNYVKDTVNNKLEPLYNQLFNQNITTMKGAAITYFTTDRLPSKVGESVTITLKEMQDKKLVFDLIDSNNNKCDVNESYVKIEKQKTEYLMTVKLNCSDKKDYIEVHLGCYDYCKSTGVCEKREETTNTVPVVTKKYRYEYQKITDGKWGPWSDWSDWSTTESTKTDNRNVETKEETKQTGNKEITVDALATVKKTYSCKEGTLNGTKCIIESTNTKVVDATKSSKTVYSCPTGFTLNGTKCTKNVKTTLEATKATKYTCPTGFTLNGTKCTKQVTTNANITNTYTDWEYQGKYTYNSIQYSSDVRKVVRVSSSINTNCTTNCTENTYTYLVYTRNKNTKYTCPTGTLNNTKCISTSTIDATKTTNYSCLSGFTLDGKNCYRNDIVTINATSKTSYSYSCKEGTLKGELCYISDSTNKTIDAKVTTSTTYSCKEGTLNGNKCVKSVPVYATYKYYRIQTREFIPGTKDIKWSTSKKDKDLLKQGYVLTGNKELIK